MTITVAGTKKTYADDLTVQQLIELENVGNPQYVSVTLNQYSRTKLLFARKRWKRNGHKHEYKPVEICT